MIPRAMRALGFCVSVGHAQFMASDSRARSACGGALGDEPPRRAESCLARPRRREGARRLHRRPLQRGHRHPERRHAATAASDRQSDALPAATRARAAEGAGEDASARCSTSSGRTARSSASTGGCARCSAGRVPTSSGRFGTTFRSCPPAAASTSTRWRRRSCSAASAQRFRAPGASGAPSFARSATSGSASTSRAAGSISRTSTPAATAGRKCAARRASVAAPEGLAETALLRAVGRLLHVDDDERLDAYPRLLGGDSPPVLDGLSPRERRLLRMLVSSLTSV